MQFPQSQCCNNSYLPPYNGSYSGCGNQYPIVPGINPALQTWNGQNFVVADGSSQNPILLPNLQQSQFTASYLVGADNNGRLSYYSGSAFSQNNNFGAFYDTTTQSSGGTTSSNLVTFNTTDVSNGIYIVNGSKITLSKSGYYLINLLGQFIFTGGSTNYDITIWYAINGTAATASSYTYTIGSSQRSQVIANVEDISYFNSGDYIQFYWWSNITQSSITLAPTAAGTNPTRPLSPSVNANIIQIK
jgi:hypothetical protein